jgi:long-subunit fatty acid transport protein
MSVDRRCRIIRALPVLLTAGCALFGNPSTAQAQSSIAVPIQFDFLNPGARSLALGSAFVGLADDATAAWVNPAGLLQLGPPEVSIEGRYHRQSQPFLVGGRLSGQITGMGEDTIAGPEYRDITDSGAGLTFLSFTFRKPRFAVAAYRHELIRVEQVFNSSGVFQNHGSEGRDFGIAAVRDLSIVSYGVSVATNWRALTFGAGISLNTFNLGLDFNRLNTALFVPYGPPDPTQNVLHLTQDGDATSPGYVAGVLLPLASAAKIGVAYRRGPRFPFSMSSTSPLSPSQQTTANFKVPDVFAVGVSARHNWLDADGNPIGSFLVTTEYKRVMYSELREDYLDVLVNQGTDTRARADRFSIADGNEAHVGVEYGLVALRVTPLLRAGIWFDPDHSVHYTPSPANDLFDERFAATLSSGRDLWHYTFGLGLALSSHFEVNFGGDLTSRSTIISTSAIVRF